MSLVSHTHTLIHTHTQSIHTTTFNLRELSTHTHTHTHQIWHSDKHCWVCLWPGNSCQSLSHTHTHRPTHKQREIFPVRGRGVRAVNNVTNLSGAYCKAEMDLASGKSQIY